MQGDAEIKQLRRCAGCHETRPTAEFYRWRGKWQSYCKDCRRARARDWYRNRRARRRLEAELRQAGGR